MSDLIQMPWKQLGTITATGTVLGVTGREYAAAVLLTTATVIWSPLPRNLNQLIIRVRGKTNGDDALIDVYGGRLCKAQNCDLQRICTITAEIGAQSSWDGATNYTLLADELALSNTTTQWPVAPISYQSGAAADLTAHTVLDPCGIDVLVFHCHTTLTNAIAIDGTGYYSPK